VTSAHPVRESNNFDALRLIAALCVIVSHEFLFLGLPEPRVVRAHSLGSIGVLIFFSISGALVLQSWQRDPDVYRFATKRFLRILPGMVAANAFASVLEWLFHAHLLPNWSMWTIPLEGWCYVGLAIMASLLSRPALPVFAALFALWVYLGETGSYLLVFAQFFAFGAVVDQYPQLLRARCAIPILLVGAWLVSRGQAGAGLLLLVPTLTIGIGRQSWPILRDAGRFGDLSYGAYIYAWPVQRLMIPWVGWPFLKIIWPTVAIVLGMAWLSWTFVEKPALALKPRASA